jgi:hypothetical protein
MESLQRGRSELMGPGATKEEGGREEEVENFESGGAGDLKPTVIDGRDVKGLALPHAIVGAGVGAGEDRGKPSGAALVHHIEEAVEVALYLEMHDVSRIEDMVRADGLDLAVWRLFLQRDAQSGPGWRGLGGGSFCGGS